MASVSTPPGTTTHLEALSGNKRIHPSITAPETVWINEAVVEARRKSARRGGERCSGGRLCRLITHRLGGMSANTPTARSPCA